MSKMMNFKGLFGKFYMCAFWFSRDLSLFSLYFIIEAFSSCWSSANSGLFLDSKSMAHLGAQQRILY
jgi:hypothetical protein